MWTITLLFFIIFKTLRMCRHKSDRYTILLHVSVYVCLISKRIIGSLNRLLFLTQVHELSPVRDPQQHPSDWLTNRVHNGADIMVLPGLFVVRQEPQRATHPMKPVSVNLPAHRQLHCSAPGPSHLSHPHLHLH